MAGLHAQGTSITFTGAFSLILTLIFCRWQLAKGLNLCTPSLVDHCLCGRLVDRHSHFMILFKYPWWCMS